MAQKQIVHVVNARKRTRLFDSQDLEEEGLLMLTNDENVRMIKLLVFENHYLIL